MDLNLVVLCGRVASAPDVRESDSGERVLRLLLTVHSELPRRRIDVIPVSFCDPPDDIIAERFEVSDRVWVTGMLQRRFRDGPTGRRGRLEVFAREITHRQGDLGASIAHVSADAGD